MKTMILLGALVSAVGLSSANLRAAQQPDNESIQSVTFKKGALLATVETEAIEATNSVTFPKNIVITTNGVFKVGSGKARPLAEGQVLSRDGMLSSADGSIVPVEDHLTGKGGRVLVVKDGEAQALTTTLKLKDGTRVHPDGRMISPRNALKRLLDGQTIRLSEGGIEATDTAQLEKGKVILFKDGARLELKAGQIIAMSDGSKIDSKGLIAKPDGSKVKLKDGETYKFPGAGTTR